MSARLCVLLFLLAAPVLSNAQSVNQDESRVPAYALPELLRTSSGETVKSAKDWERKRRPEILKIFEREVYGQTPGTRIPVSYQVKSVEKAAFGGKATRKEIRVQFPQGKFMDLLLYVPNDARGKVPVFLGLNFLGNQSLEKDPSIPLTASWQRNNKGLGVAENRATENTRGASMLNWPVEYIISKGYALATVYYCDIFPDHADGREASIQTLFVPGKDPQQEWGAIGAWAWGLSRAVDYLETDPAVDAKKIAVLGHSRLGKAAIWAGAQDKRFGVVISNNSGEGGAAITRRGFGETIAVINKNFPHWFAPNYKKYSGKENDLPVDYHELIALIAPRPVYVASASEDLWADPKGEYLSLYHAGPVYRLYGKQILDSPEPPAAQKPVSTDFMGYHMREGGHDILLYDWEQYVKFADKHFKSK